MVSFSNVQTGFSLSSYLQIDGKQKCRYICWKLIYHSSIFEYLYFLHISCFHTVKKYHSKNAIKWLDFRIILKFIVIIIKKSNKNNLWSTLCNLLEYTKTFLKEFTNCFTVYSLIIFITLLIIKYLFLQNWINLILIYDKVCLSVCPCIIIGF